MSILEIDQLNQSDKRETPELAEYENIFIDSLLADDEFSYIEAFCILVDLYSNGGSISENGLESFDLDSFTAESIEIAFHTNIILKSNLDWTNYGVWAEQTAYAFQGLAIAMMYGSPLDGYYGNAIDNIGQQSIEGKTPVIGKMHDLNKPGSISGNEYKVSSYLANQGTPRANWKNNSSVLRNVMGFGIPIRDASNYPYSNYGFLAAERNLLMYHGWYYDSGYWNPPTK